jgi:hypothetical protein
MGDMSMRRILAVLLTLAPFAAAAIAALSVRRDFRLAWMALAATVVARAVFMFRRARAATPFMTVASLVAATLASSAVAVVLGARSPIGIFLIAAVLSGSAALGAALGATPPPVHR